MAGEDVVDEVHRFLELATGDEDAGAREQGDGLGFGADVGFADDLPFLEGSADVAGVDPGGSVVHGEQQDGEPRRRADVGGGAGLDLPGSVLPDEFRAGMGAEQERRGEEGFSGKVHASEGGSRPRSGRRRRRRSG